MIIKQNKKLITLEKGSSKFRFLETGDVYDWMQQGILLNQLLGNELDGSLNNVYLRVYEEGNMQVYPLMGMKSNASITHGASTINYQGTCGEISYTICFQLSKEGLYYLHLEFDGEGQVDVIYGQDISIADRGATQSNELYVSQYIDHKALQSDHGYVLCSRQNQKQGGKNPYLQIGCLDVNVVSYCTDGMQFFGKQYKQSNEPIIVKQDLPGKIYQFEMAYIGLQSEKFDLSENKAITFYGCFKEDHPLAIQELEYQEEIFSSYQALEERQTCVSTIRKVKDIQGIFSSQPFDQAEIDKRYPSQKFLEKDGDTTFSFFTDRHHHVVSQAKEVRSERPHGHIITSGLSLNKIDSRLITSTNYMYGIFQAHVVIGNTNLNKLSSTPRSLLNTMKNSGMRIYVKHKGTYQLLSLPAIYELSVNQSTWLYRIGDDVLNITTYTACDRSDLILELTSEKQIEYEFIISQQLNMACDEFHEEIDLEVKGQSVLCKPVDGSFLKDTYPDIEYQIHSSQPFELSDDEIFFEDHTSRNTSLITMNISACSSLRILTQGRLDRSCCDERMHYTSKEEEAKFHKLYQTLTCDFHVSTTKEDEKLDKINEVFWWYTHNAMTHFAVPHGLEQPGGAAWGTRDISQGPFEYFMATQNFTLCRAILIEVFAHQFLETGEWPQWFMYDQYQMQQDDSHGDVIFWPLKILGDYLHATGDQSILEEPIIYRHFPNGAHSDASTMLEHVKTAIHSIEGRFLYNTHLISYAGGDWDDTLQPASSELKEKLVSSWTMALAYQCLHQLSIVLEGQQLAQICNHHAEAIRKDFLECLVKDDVIAGFARVESEDDISFMLHPRDEQTGIQYRLIPMTRSIIAEMVDLKQALKNIDVIDEQLKCEDGVRLMNHPANYTGGVSTFFQRAEQASNVGREIGLQYCHAHVRYIEALAKLGEGERVWEAMYKIMPINIKDHVKNASMRQSNCYFSSSDGDFVDRYEYQEKFDKLRSGDVSVKGGWRIYSSGPGIYLNQIVSNVFGIQIHNDFLQLDPVLSSDVPDVTLQYRILDYPVSIHYVCKQAGKSIAKVCVNGHVVNLVDMVNPYRIGGKRIALKELVSVLHKHENHIEIELQ